MLMDQGLEAEAHQQRPAEALHAQILANETT